MTKKEIVIENFYKLSEEAARIDSEELDRPLEPVLSEILDFVQENVGYRSALSDIFLELVYQPSKAPLDLIEYCMHDLRWEEVRLGLLDKLELEDSERVRYVLKGLISSFRDDWGGADFYDRFK